jgi:hypothetical protein
MGLLDDAIREHLELKRRHGADAAEVARQEREALGPARRTAEDERAPEGPAAETSGAAEAGAADPAAEADDLVVREFEPHERPPLPDAEPSSAAGPPAAGGAVSVSRGDAADAADDLWAPEDDEDADEPQVAVPFEPAGGEDPLPEEDRLAEEPPTAGDPPRAAEEADVLEETPEFLEETPEHDRLWFEQRPPRDFDFDG